MSSLLAVLTGVLVGSLVNVFVNFEGRYKPLIKWYFTLYYQNARSIFTTAGLGLIFYIVYTKYGTGFCSLSYMILTAILFAASIKDIQNRIIPNKLIVLGLILGVILNCLFFSFGRIADSLTTFVLAGGILLSISFVSKGGLGIGDAKLIACTGMLLGAQKTISVMIISFLASALFGVFSVLFKKLNRKSAMAFAPFVLFGVVLTIITG